MANQTSSGSSRLTDAQLVALSRASQRSDGRITVPPHLRGAAVQRFLQSLLAKHLIAQVPAKVGAEAGVYVISRSGLEALGLEPAEVGCRGDGESFDPGGTARAGPACDDLSSGPAPRKAQEQKRNMPKLIITSGRRPNRYPLTEGAPGDADGASIGRHQFPHVAEAERINIDAGKDAADLASIPNYISKDDADPGEPARDSDSAVARAPRASSKLSQVITLLGRSDGATLGEVMAQTGWLAHTSRAALTGLRKRGYPLERIRNGNEAQSLYRIACDVIA